MGGKAQPDDRPGVQWIETLVPFFAVCGLKYTRLGDRMLGRHCSLQRRFPIHDILLQFEDMAISCKIMNYKSEFFSNKILGGVTPKLHTKIFMPYEDTSHGKVYCDSFTYHTI